MNVSQYKNIVNRFWERNSYKVTVKHPWKVPTMLLRGEKKLLCYLTEQVYSEAGKIIDLGCFLGGSTSFLAQGLKNSNKKSEILSFDLFKLSNFEKTIFFPKYNLQIPDEDDFENMFLENTKPYKSIVKHHKGNILNYEYASNDIELLFVDLMKSHKIYDHIIQEFLPSLMPMKGVMILQDYYFKNTGIWHQILPYMLQEKFTYLTDTGTNSAVFLCIEKITQEDIEKCKWDNITFENKVDSIFHALNFCKSENQKTILKEIFKSNLREETNRGEIYND